MRIAFLILGLFATGLGVVGIFLPLLPTVPFMLHAAFFFARSNPEWERRIVEHPRFGPPIRAWRERGAIGRGGKIGSAVALGLSAAAGLVSLESPWRFVPLAVALVCGAWILTRPD